MSLVGSTIAVWNSRTSCRSGLSGGTGSAHSGEMHTHKQTLPPPPPLPELQWLNSLVINHKDAHTVQRLYTGSVKTKQMNFGRLKQAAGEALHHHCEWVEHPQREPTGTVAHHWTTPNTSWLISPPPPPPPPLSAVHPCQEKRGGRARAGREIMVNRRRNMRTQTQWDTDRWVRCGWDSPARPNHSVSCWSLHACSPGPLRRSCNTTSSWSEKRGLFVSSQHNTQKRSSRLIHKGQLQHLLFPEVSLSHFVFVFLHFLHTTFFLSFALSVFLFPSPPPVCASDGVTGLAGGMVTCWERRPTQFWLRCGPWLN